MKEDFKDSLEKLYGSDPDTIAFHKKRYEHILEMYKENFEDTSHELRFFSAPGRTEIAGNHTDHELGKVIASSVHLDLIAACQKRDDNKVNLISEGYSGIGVIDLDDIAYDPNDKSRTRQLIKGVAQGIKNLGYNIAGFNCYTTSLVPSGSGLSSSAAFEVLVLTIFNYLYNEGKITPFEEAKIGKFAENTYFSKPSGLLDQTACATGGVVAIDFKNEDKPEIKKLDLDLKDYGYQMVITRTDEGHADLTDAYAAIPEEMQSIAKYFGKDVLGQVDPEKFYKELPLLKQKFADRAILRAIHFFTEEERTVKEIACLENHDFQGFLDLVNESGYSSETQLQNVRLSGSVEHQEASLALALSRLFFKKNDLKAACRIHGGGFGGTIQAYVPTDYTEDYMKLMDSVFGKDAANIIAIRNYGGFEL